jgi:nucleoside-diphosphate-sugar epimerase
MAADRAVFLTGATGLVGGLLLRRLALENPDRTIHALVRLRDITTDLPNAHLIPGDITQPQLGMPPDVYAHLCGSIDTIVHCAASTKFTLPLSASREVNVRGTANILQLARHTAGLKMLLHISSIYVAGRRNGALEEAPVNDIAGWFSPYEQSKHEAEQLISGQDDLPWTIARLSTLVGDSRTGRVAQFNYFHQLLRLVPRNPFPMIPGLAAALVDVVADDWVTDALVAIIQRRTASRCVLHLCAGPAQSVPAQEILELAFALQKTRATMPSFVSVAEFQSFAATLRRRGEETLWRLSELLLLSMPHLEMRQTFLNTRTTATLARFGVTPLQTRAFLPSIMRSCF